MFKQIFLIFTCILLVFNFNASYAIDEKSLVDVQEIFTSSENIDGDEFSYPNGKAEMRLIRVEVDKGGTIPMHSHPVPSIDHIESGEFTLEEKTGISKTFKEGDSFVLSANTPAHTMGLQIDSSAVIWVAVASAEGMPSLNPEL